MPRVQAGGRREEETVAGHRPRDPCAGEHEAVDAAERRDHDRDGHDDGAHAAAYHGLHDRRADAVGGRVLDPAGEDVGAFRAAA